MPPAKKVAVAPVSEPKAAPVAKKLSVSELAALAHLGPKILGAELWAEVQAVTKKGGTLTGDTQMGPKLLNG